MDNFERKITTPQTEPLPDIKGAHTGDVEKIKEVYKGDVLDAVIYYLDTMEPEGHGVARVLQRYPQINYFEIISKEYWKTYRIEVTRCYRKGGVYDDFQITCLYDDRNRLLYERTLSIEKGNAEEELEKYLYPEDGSEYLIFKYDVCAVSLIGVSGGRPPFVPENDHFIKITEFPRYFPDLLTNNPYYANTDMLL